MRKAAGIILIIIGIVEVVNMITGVSISSGSFLEWLLIFAYWSIVYGALFVTGGILCMVKKYWGLCLISALLALVGGLHKALLFGDKALLFGGIAWDIWILVVGGIIATIFISLRKKEWQEIAD